MYSAIAIDILNSAWIDGIFHMVHIDRHIFLSFSTEHPACKSLNWTRKMYSHGKKTMIRKFCFFFVLLQKKTRSRQCKKNLPNIETTNLWECLRQTIYKMHTHMKSQSAQTCERTRGREKARPQCIASIHFAFVRCYRVNFVVVPLQTLLVWTTWNNFQVLNKPNYQNSKGHDDSNSFSNLIVKE